MRHKQISLIMKKILGLDLGTNSIGWAIINQETINDKDIVNGIECTGSRIIPMDAATMGNYDKGNPQSQTAERTKFRSTRKLIERSHIRRERLNRVLMTMGWLPEHYSDSLDRYGKLSKGTEPKIAWKKNGNGDYEFIFKDCKFIYSTSSTFSISSTFSSSCFKFFSKSVN